MDRKAVPKGQEGGGCVGCGCGPIMGSPSPGFTLGVMDKGRARQGAPGAVYNSSVAPRDRGDHRDHVMSLSVATAHSAHSQVCSLGGHHSGPQPLETKISGFI